MKTVIRKNISDRMLKTMKNQMLPERGEGCRCKGKTPKTFMYVCMWQLCAESDVSGVLSMSSDNDLPISGNSGEALHL